MTKILLSIVIPLYNQEKFVKLNAEKLIRQISNQPIEIIFVDDGSIDDTSSEINKLRINNEQQIILINQSNHGAYHARNQGLKKSRGEFVYFIDGDDFVTNEFVSVIVPVLKQNYQKDLFVFGYDRVTMKGEVISEYFDRYNFPSNVGSISGRLYDVYVKKKYRLSNINVIYKSKFLRESLIEYPALYKGEDIVFIFKAFIGTNQIMFINKRLAFYIIHEESISHNSSIKRLDTVIARLLILRKTKTIKNEDLTHFFRRLFYRTIKAYLKELTRIDHINLINSEKKILQEYPNLKKDLIYEIKKWPYLGFFTRRYYLALIRFNFIGKKYLLKMHV